MERAKGAQLREKSSQEGEEAMAATASAAIFAFLAHPLSLLRHVCAGYLGIKDDLKPSAPASSSAAAAAACQQDEVEAAASEDSTVGLQVRSRGFTPPQQPRSTPVESIGGSGGRHH
ncbi:hypothetical protein GQ55_6G049200 [Panicum hallii var. hallii]|uniref:Uncharacterized protein n=1 Tax=Panicum hallii var. hallii TaxID=1504633 RepID=A0A2T7D435_9POAL|nr:hypothetical protein GQ55_6G049200 [Panicum hallii var. hallii]